MKFGNLDSLTFGMGLVATPGQTIPAKNARFEGVEDATSCLPALFAIIAIVMMVRFL